MPSCGDRRDQRLHRHFGTFLVSHYDRIHYRIYIDCSLYSTVVASFFFVTGQRAQHGQARRGNHTGRCPPDRISCPHMCRECVGPSHAVRRWADFLCPSVQFNSNKRSSFVSGPLKLPLEPVLYLPYGGRRYFNHAWLFIAKYFPWADPVNLPA
jgi:hypothetical protein